MSACPQPPMACQQLPTLIPSTPLAFPSSLAHTHMHPVALCVLLACGADEEPDRAELVIDAKDASGKMQSAEDMAATIMQYLEIKGYLSPPAATGAKAATA